MKNILKKLNYYSKHPTDLVSRILPLFPLSDENYIRIWYRLMYGEKLNLENPRTYNEKLQWLKLYNHQPEYKSMVDKYAVKDYVKKRIGCQYVIPLLAIYDRPEDICFDELPNQFVLKVTHGGGNSGVVVCKDKMNFDHKKAIYKLQRAMTVDGSIGNKEWPYKNVKRRVIAEQYMEDNATGELRDYKFFCFHGVPRIMFVASGRGTQPEPNFDWFDMDYQRLPLKTEHPNSSLDKLPVKPSSFEEMKRLAAKLSAGIPHVRVDFYEVNGHPYFGEYTFFHWSGINHFEPEEWNLRMGEWITLPPVKTI